MTAMRRAHGHGLDLIVGHVDHRGLEALVELDEFGARLHAHLGVEVGERLVEEEDLRLAHDGPAQGDALALAAGELLGFAVEVGVDAQDARRLGDAFLDLGLGYFRSLRPKAMLS